VLLQESTDAELTDAVGTQIMNDVELETKVQVTAEEQPQTGDDGDVATNSVDSTQSAGLPQAAGDSAQNTDNLASGTGGSTVVQPRAKTVDETS